MQKQRLCYRWLSILLNIITLLLSDTNLTCRILGENNKNLPKIVEILTVVLSREDLMEAKFQPRALELLKQLQTNVPSQVHINMNKHNYFLCSDCVVDIQDHSSGAKLTHIQLGLLCGRMKENEKQDFISGLSFLKSIYPAFASRSHSDECSAKRYGLQYPINGIANSLFGHVNILLRMSKFAMHLPNTVHPKLITRSVQVLTGGCPNFFLENQCWLVPVYQRSASSSWKLSCFLNDLFVTICPRVAQ